MPDPAMVTTVARRLAILAALIAPFAPALSAPVPIVVAGRLAGVTGFGDSGCVIENCAPYVDVGTLSAIDRQPVTDLPTAIVVQRGDATRRIEINADWQGASMLDVRRIRRFLQPGRRVMLIGRRRGDGTKLIVELSEILSADFAEKLAAADKPDPRDGRRASK